MACSSLLLRLLPIPGLPPLGPDTSTTDATIRDRLEMVTGVDDSVGRLLEDMQAELARLLELAG